MNKLIFFLLSLPVFAGCSIKSSTDKTGFYHGRDITCDSGIVVTGRFHHQWFPDILYHEINAIDGQVMESLTEMGHELKERSSIGSMNAIMILPGGKKAGAADKRNNNSSCGY